MNIQNLTKRSLGAIIGTVALSSSSPVLANMSIYSNGSPNGSGASFSDFSFPQQTADNFLLNTPVFAQLEVNWWGVYASSNTPPATDNFTIRIFANIGTSLSTPVVNPLYQFQVGNEVNRIATSNKVFGFNEFSYSTVISGLSLNARTNYWLSIVNNTANDFDDNWAWSNSNVSGNARSRGSDLVSWSSLGGEMAFNFVIVPEPSSIVALVSLGLLGLVYRKKMP